MEEAERGTWNGERRQFDKSVRGGDERSCSAPRRATPRYIAGTGPSPDDAGRIRSGCDSIRLYAIKQNRYRPVPRAPAASINTEFGM